MNEGPWWASGRTPSEGYDRGEDPFEAHARARHGDTEVCDACPICIALRAVRQTRPEVITHLAEAAQHIALALQAIAEAPAGSDDGLQHIDLDP